MRKIKDKFIFSQSRHRVKHFEENEYAFLNQNFFGNVSVNVIQYIKGKLGGQH